MSDDEARRYSIRTVHDFLKVPADRLGTCLLEFNSWLALIAATKDLPGVRSIPQSYEWIDDGLRNMNIILNVHEPESK